MLAQIRGRFKTLSGGEFVAALVILLLALNVSFGTLADDAGATGGLLLAVIASGIGCAALWVTKQSRHARAYGLMIAMTGLPVFAAAVFGGGAFVSVGIAALLLLGAFAYIAATAR